jgi:hypothetical protein
MDANQGRLPVEDGIEVISVGISFEISGMPLLSINLLAW